MMEDVERLFTEHFAKDEKNAMMFLRPVQNEASHKITFFLGKNYVIWSLASSHAKWCIFVP